MSKTFFISDPHFDHKNILNFVDRRGLPLRPFKTVEEMNEAIIDNWNGVVKPADRVYLLGDVAFDYRTFDRIVPRLAGRICLVPGNHEPVKSRRYFYLFDDVRGYVQRNGFIASHIPIHPDSLGRWKINIHGHLHADNVRTNANNPLYDPETQEGMREPKYILVEDPRYYNVSVEQIGYTPKNLEEIFAERGI